MKEFIESLFGVYEPIMTQEVITTEVEGALSTETVEVVASGLAGVDWPWVAGVFLFGIVLWSFFRLVGVFLKL